MAPFSSTRKERSSNLLRKPMMTTSLRTLDVCRQLFDTIDRNTSNYVDDLIRICEVAAPTFREGNRARYFASLFESLRCSPSIDEAGNVRIPFLQNGPPHVVLSAHLDTVFSLETIRVTRKGNILYAPGISDDSSGLAALVSLARAFLETGLPESGTLTFLATVGEEGLGNLRGTRHYFSTMPKDDINCFISLDGCDAERLVVSGLASKRVRVFFRGPGGHSWGDAGTPNPIQIAGEFLYKLNRFSLPRKPKTTLNAGIIHGGTSINAIPTEMFLDIDLRSESTEALARLDESMSNTLKEIGKQERAITTEIQILGERPAGAIREDHPLVQIAMAANQQFGLGAQPDSGSTDSNIPFALGIPAITLGTGGTCGKIHTQEEWFDVSGVEKGLKRTALLLMELLHREK